MLAPPCPTHPPPHQAEGAGDCLGFAARDASGVLTPFRFERRPGAPALLCLPPGCCHARGAAALRLGGLQGRVQRRPQVAARAAAHAAFQPTTPALPPSAVQRALMMCASRSRTPASATRICTRSRMSGVRAALPPHWRACLAGICVLPVPGEGSELRTEDAAAPPHGGPASVAPPCQPLASTHDAPGARPACRPPCAASLYPQAGNSSFPMVPGHEIVGAWWLAGRVRVTVVVH